MFNYCHSERSEDELLRTCPKNLENIHVDILVYVTEILPPFGRLNDKGVLTDNS